MSKVSTCQKFIWICLHVHFKFFQLVYVRSKSVSWICVKFAKSLISIYGIVHQRIQEAFYFETIKMLLRRDVDSANMPTVDSGLDILLYNRTLDFKI